MWLRTPSLALSLSLLPLVLSVALVFSLIREADAHLDKKGEYSFKNDDCRRGPLDNKSKLQYADPIGVVMRGTGLRGPQRVNQILRHEAGWGPTELSPHQYFIDHGDCLENNIDSADRGLCKCNRYHTRGRFQFHGRDLDGDPDTYGNPVYHAVLTPHRDVWRDSYIDENGVRRCDGPADGTHYVHKNTGHGSGFDRGRIELKSRLEDQYGTTLVPWGNDVTVKQCNGQLAGSAGNVWFINVGRH